ncbi:tail fiber protein [Wenyingzhuangia marina]|uniref:Uncharacterized protein n=1 Tax=Wenyingzhuangia marina TaxID=1195760 RepID=A0A1M5U4S6_9FLAO|nr:tail fiber protein [Wenyingzhuangia marina]GGF69572.1 hypothetical protein GCM10011397_10640 [Wenyingzhuangia marina]SHH57969.1 hypothetical protein SAMN05444281_1033 [Wenyingzhuangia marina]
MKKRILLIALIGISFNITAQNGYISGTAGIMSKIHITNPSVGSDGAYLDLNMGLSNLYAAGIKGYVPTGQPGIDRVFLGLYTTTYDGGLQKRIERMTISDRGNVGIGTIRPLSKLDVSGTTGVMSKINITNPSVGSDGAYLDFNMGSSDVYAAGIKGYVPTGQPGIDRVFLGFYTTTYDDGLQSRIERMTISDRGNIGIGTTTPDSKLTVAGNIHSREVKVTINAGADFVFNKDYNLPSLESVEKYLKNNKHLPEIASEKEMKENGLLLAEMNIKLLQKIEELTLYTIQQEKEIEELKFIALKFIELEKRLERLEK